GRIRISGASAEGRVSMTVEDTGVGMPPEMLPLIFDMVMQVPGRRGRGQGGLGIGLTLAKRLVELHGGTIEARSPGPGQGSTFTVRVPAGAPGGTRGLGPGGGPGEQAEP